MHRYLLHVRESLAPWVCDYDSLHRWSIAEPSAFWASIWSFCGVRAARPYDSVVDDAARMPGARWFEGARLSFADNLLGDAGQEPAIIAYDEGGRRGVVSRSALRARVSRVAAALRERGVSPGDRVAGFMPNVPETVIAMLAASSLGAIWSSCSPEFGVNAVVDRFGQIEPSVLFAADACTYGGKRIDLTPRLRGILAALPSVRHAVIVSRTGGAVGTGSGSEIVAFGDLETGGAPDTGPVSLPFDHPLYIMYSSGTTGAPKCILHGSGGTLVQHLKEQVLHVDVQPGDRVFYYTTCGWMMWNWLVSNLAAGATIVLYDGSPVHPGPDALWRMAAAEDLSVFGTSAGYLSAIEKSGLRPAGEFDLPRLRTILSTGSPLAPRSYDYVYRDIKEDVCLSSISGGTDIISCFALGNPIGPVHRGEIQCRGLGMKVEVLDDGEPVHGRKGELCCTMAFPSMPLSFWNDPDGRRYHEAYFSKIAGVWCHGDYAELTDNGGVIIHGRSDATLNPGGVRIGTAEIYRVVERLPEVLECLAAGQEWNDDIRVVLFVVLRPGLALDDALRLRIRDALRTEASPRHVPAKVVQVREIPRTVSGKIVEIAVQNVINGRPVPNRDALARPEILDQFIDLPELREP